MRSQRPWRPPQSRLERTARHQCVYIRKPAMLPVAATVYMIKERITSNSGGTYYGILNGKRVQDCSSSEIAAPFPKPPSSLRDRGVRDRLLGRVVLLLL